MRPSFSNSKMKRKLDLDYVSEWVFLCCWGSDPGSCMTEGHALPWSHTITSDSVHTPPAWYRESRKVLILNRSFLSPLNSLPLSLFLPTTISRTYILRHVQALVPLLQKISHHRSDPVVQTWGMSCGQPCMLACQQVHHWSSPRLWRAKLYPGVMPFRPKSEAAAGESASVLQWAGRWLRKKPCHRWASQGCLSMAVKSCLSSVCLVPASQCL